MSFKTIIIRHSELGVDVEQTKHDRELVEGAKAFILLCRNMQGAGSNFQNSKL